MPTQDRPSTSLRYAQDERVPIPASRSSRPSSSATLRTNVCRSQPPVRPVLRLRSATLRTNVCRSQPPVRPVLRLRSATLRTNVCRSQPPVRPVLRLRSAMLRTNVCRSQPPVRPERSGAPAERSRRTPFRVAVNRRSCSDSHRMAWCSPRPAPVLTRSRRASCSLAASTDGGTAPTCLYVILPAGLIKKASGMPQTP